PRSRGRYRGRRSWRRGARTQASRSPAARRAPTPRRGRAPPPPPRRDPRRPRAHDERRDEVARHVDPDARDRQPAPLQPHAGLDLELDVARPLRLVPAADAVGEREQRFARQQLRLRNGARRLDAVELQRPFAHGFLAATAHILDDPHRNIRSTGTTRIENAPTASSRGRSCQTSLAGTSACTATIPGSASGITLGEREPITSQISSRRAAGASSIRYRWARASTTARSIDTSWPAGAPARPISTAWDEKSVTSERSPFVRSVFPDETRSTIASARPSRGAISTEPVTSTSSTSTGRSSRVIRGKTVATDAPARSSTRPYADSSGTATSSRHEPKPSSSSSSTRAPRSRTRSWPVMPQSTTPS